MATKNVYPINKKKLCSQNNQFYLLASEKGTIKRCIESNKQTYVNLLDNAYCIPYPTLPKLEYVFFGIKTPNPYDF